MNKRIPALLLCLFLVLTLIPVSVFAADTPLKITKQPANSYAAAGEMVSTSVAAQGDELRYQWYLKHPWQDKFYESAIKDGTYSVTMTEKISGRQVYCVVTDCHGNSVTTDTVTLETPPAIRIIRQPANGYAFPGQTVTTSVTAKGEGLRYQWYLKNPGQDRFYESAETGNTYSVTMTEEMSGRQVYCVITDRDGNTVQTKTATLWRNGVFHKELMKVKHQGTRNLAQELTFHTATLLQWQSSDTSIAEVDATGTVTGLKHGTVTITVTDKVSNHTAQCQLKVCDLKQVALTFDDGPSTHTKRLLDFLKENDVPVTFFVVGDRMNSYSKTLQRAVDEGHEIGYHSYSHKTQTYLSSSRITSDFETSNALLKSLTGAEFTLWRTPGGNYNERVLDCVPLPHIMWSVDTRDWERRNSSSVYRAIVNGSKDGSIVLLHDLYSSTVDGAIKAMEEMLEGDYEFLTVTELLRRNGNAPEPHTTYHKAN